MPPIKHTQLFDFPAYEAAIKGAKAASEEFGKSLEGTLNRLQKEQRELNASLKEYATILKGFSAIQAGASTALKNYNQQIDENISGITELKALQKGLAQVVDISKASVQQLEAEMKGLSAQYKALKPGQADYHTQVDGINKRLKEIVPTVQAFNQALKNSKQSVDVVEGSYKNMQAQLGALRNTLRALPGAFDPVTGRLNKSNKEAVGLSKEITRLDTALKQADKTMGLFARNVGNYQSAFKGFAGGLTQAIGAVIGIQSAFEAVAFTFKTNLDFDSLNSAIKLVSGSTQEFEKNQGFLKNTAENLGLEIIGLTKNFKSFYAAATTAGLSADVTRKIFEQVSRVGANLKLSQDDLNGVFTAFGQIISKGKVQAEELRGQIGERLPGAFAVAAKAIGVTQAQLNDMLKDGKVISDEFLPKFADELEKTFGGGTERVEGMQAAVNRFNNALKDIVSDENGGVAKLFTMIIELSTRALKGINLVADGLINLKDFTVQGATAVAAVRNSSKDQEDINTSVEERVSAYQTLIKSMKEAGNTQVQIQIALSRVTNQYEEQLAAANKERDRLLLDPNNGQSFQGVKDAIKLAESLKRTLGEISSKRITLKTGASGAPVDDEAARKAAEKAQKEFEEMIRRKQALLKNLADLQELENERAFINEEKSEREFQERKLEIIDEYAGMATDLENQLGKRADEVRLAGFKETLAKAQLEYEKYIQKSAPKSSTVKGPARADTAGIDTDKSLNSGFIDTFNAEIAAREAKIKRELELEAEKAARLKEINQMTVDILGQAAFSVLDIISNAQEARFEKRISMLETEKDRELQIAGQNVAARERIEFEYRKKINREKNKQAREERKNALFEVAINTAVGIAKTFAELGWPAGIPGAAFVLAQGVLQAGVIAAKPLPAYKVGTQSAKKGHALVNEEGFELIEKNGRMRVAPGRNTIVKMEGGEKVHTHSESKSILRNIFKTMASKTETGSNYLHDKIAGTLSQLRHNEQVLMMEKVMSRGQNLEQLERAFSSAVSRIPVNQTLMDERGMRKRTIELNQVTTYLNKQHSL